MMDNERRADLGAFAVWSAANLTNVAQIEPAETAVEDVLSYVLHFAVERLGMDLGQLIPRVLHSFEGDAEDGPPAGYAPHNLEASLVGLPHVGLWLGRAHLSDSRA